MLHNICQELTRENTSDFLFLCEDRIPRSRCEHIKDPRDLFYALEQVKTVGPDNLHFLSLALAEIHRRDLAQKVEEHCKKHGVRRLEDDNAVLPTSSGKTGQVTPSFVSSLVPRGIRHESSNEVVSYRPARVLEPDEARPITSSSNLSITERSRWLETQTHHDSRVTHSVPQTEGVLEPDEALPVNADDDIPRYAMKRKPRGKCTPCINYC